MNTLSTKALTAILGAAMIASPALADVKTGELNRAYLKGKSNSKFGKQTMYDELMCFQLYNVWSKLTVSYTKNLAMVNGELSNGYSQLQFYHYALRWANHVQAKGNNYDAIWLGIADEIEQTNWLKEKNQKKLGRMLGECVVPLNRVSTIPASSDQGRADSWFERNFNQPYKEVYPKWAKDKKAWDTYSAAWRAGNPLIAARTVIANFDKGDKKTFHDNEYLVAVEAVVDIGGADQLPQSAYMRAAYLNPDKFAQLAGYNPADFKPEIRMIKGRGSYLGASSASGRARSAAENDAKYKCELAKGKVVRVSSVPVESYKATETTWRSTYEATAQCEFPPKLN